MRSLEHPLFQLLLLLLLPSLVCDYTSSLLHTNINNYCDYSHRSARAGSGNVELCQISRGTSSEFFDTQSETSFGYQNQNAIQNRRFRTQIEKITIFLILVVSLIMINVNFNDAIISFRVLIESGSRLTLDYYPTILGDLATFLYAYTSFQECNILRNT